MDSEQVFLDWLDTPSDMPEPFALVSVDISDTAIGKDMTWDQRVRLERPSDDAKRNTLYLAYPDYEEEAYYTLTITR